MTEEKKEPQVVENPPPVCGLCWDWILAGEAIAMLAGDPVHMRCWKTVEAY
jgi:hypothetical protein